MTSNPKRIDDKSPNGIEVHHADKVWVVRRSVSIALEAEVTAARSVAASQRSASSCWAFSIQITVYLTTARDPSEFQAACVRFAVAAAVRALRGSPANALHAGAGD